MPDADNAGAAGSDITLDARFLDPPEPFVQTMEALDRIAPGACLRLLLYREPFPLYNTLAQNGFTHKTHMEDDGTFVIEIRHAS
jgi:tRNA 2-thiouridine synthesizing protein A